ncbi:MAG: cobalamin-binding protein [Ferruginibacter sp.]|nr:cobalamin-binding protein [Ferruginibacter sp.]
MGITKFCVHPKEWSENKIRIGGTKALHIEKIKELKPDLIIANKEENVKDQIEELALNFPVWLTEVCNLQDATQMIEDIGHLTQKQKEAAQVISQIQHSFDGLKYHEEKIPSAYLIWKKPYMTAGSDTFIHDMMHKAGFENVFASKKRYPEITIEDLKNSGCKIVLLSSEPYPFKEKHIQEIECELPGVKAIVVDGEMFSWYGSRLLSAPPYFNKLYGQCRQSVS